jgi:hypothetical protein
MRIAMTGRDGSMIDVPSAAWPGPVPMRVLLPAGWTAAEAAGAIVALQPPDVDGASVLVGASRVAVDTELRDIAVRSFARQRARHPQLRLDSQRVGRFGDRITYLRAVTVPGEPELSQIHALFFAPRHPDRAVVDAITVVGSCPTASIGSFGPIAIDVVASVEFTE